MREVEKEGERGLLLANNNSAKGKRVEAFFLKVLRNGLFTTEGG